ncbi:Hypothetical protein SSCIU_02408 [Mammaliicoccus sciuri]|nr:Hypothetical protein SSCIU_02408 [Mammaliicoccus sciuri]
MHLWPELLVTATLFTKLVKIVNSDSLMNTSCQTCS